MRPLLRHFLHFAEAFLLKLKVADGQHFVHKQNLRLQMRGDGKGQPHLHAGAEMFERRVDKALDFRESHDLVEFAVDLSLAHAENRAAQVDIFASGQLGMKSGADFEQAADAAVNFGRARGRAA